ncbi:prepilin peptidase [Rodentibacter caecimuris]|uniref:Flp operon protein B n=1 Tax=Rodentibacter caecimuris TaxID=1796644 RepID=A0ABX3KX57_9PAST|nr:flp operon protein B [Rodentibacter heylii]
MKEYLVPLLNFAVILLLIDISWTDIRVRIISNKSIMLLLAVILVFSYLRYDTVFIFSSLVSLCVGFILFVLKVIGAGDIKLISVLILAVPNYQIISFLFFTTFSGLLLIIIGWIFFRNEIKSKGLPYGVAISTGFLINSILFG